MKFTVLLLLTFLSFQVFGQKDSITKVQDLQGVEVSLKTQVLFAKQHHYIIDFEEVGSGVFVLLKKRNAYFLELIGWGGKTLWSEELSGKHDGIFKDCINNLYLIEDDLYHRFDILENLLVIEKTFSSDYVRDNFFSCVGSTNKDLVFLHRFALNQGIHLWTYDYQNNEAFGRYTYFDSLTSRSLQEEQAAVQSSQGMAIVQMGDIWIKTLKRTKAAFDRQMFFEQVLSAEPVVPCINAKGAFYLFNLSNDSVVKMNQEFDMEHERPLMFKKSLRSDNVVLYDKVQNNFYWTDYPNNQFVLFDPDSGKTIRVIKSKGVQAKHKFIRNGRVYYLGKNPLGSSFNKLFVQLL